LYQFSHAKVYFHLQFLVATSFSFTFNVCVLIIEKTNTRTIKYKHTFNSFNKYSTFLIYNFTLLTHSLPPLFSCAETKPQKKMSTSLQTQLFHLKPVHFRTPSSSKRTSLRCSAAVPSSKRSYKITLLPGDGIGPEVVSVAKDILLLTGSLHGRYPTFIAFKFSFFFQLGTHLSIYLCF